MHAAFMADDFLGDALEPARNTFRVCYACRRKCAFLNVLFSIRVSNLFSSLPGHQLVARALLRGQQQARKPPAGGTGRAAGGVFIAMHAPINARKPSNKVRLNASRTSKRRESCLGMSWRINELITLTLPKSGVARTVCYVNCFVQPTANTKKRAYQ